MTIKRRHIRMARAAKRLSWGNLASAFCGAIEPPSRESVYAIRRWHRAANGRKA